MIFTTERLIVRNFKITDSEEFYDLMGNANVMNPIPLEALSREECDKKLQELMRLSTLKSEKLIWAVINKNDYEFIGLCALIKNDENDNEIAYRLREKYWKKGFGTEIAKGLIKYSFKHLNFNKITANVNITNEKSIKILNKLMKPVREFYNKKEQCIDRRYKLEKQDWLNKNF